MQTTLLGPAQSQGSASELTPGTKLVYVGGELLLAWDADAGRWYRYARSRGRGLPFDLDAPRASGTNPGHRGWALQWAGGDRVLLYAPLSGAFEVRILDRDGTGDPLAGPVLYSGHIDPGLELTYLGRSYFAHRTTHGIGGSILRRDKNRFAVPSSDAWGPFPPPEPLWFKGGPVYWLGGDRMLRVSSKTSEADAYRYVGARVAAAVRPPFPPLPSVAIDLERADVVYVGANQVLLWRPADREWTLHEVNVLSPIEPTIEDHLELHTDVRHAIGWRIPEGPLVPYARWHEHAETADHHSALGAVYRTLASGGTPTLSYENEIDPLTSEPRIGPELVVGSWFTPAQAAEVFLAHVAQALWVDISARVPWRLDAYAPSDQQLLLRSDRLFEPGTNPGTTTLFRVSPDWMGGITPTNPSVPYRFVRGDEIAAADRVRSGPSLVGSSGAETALAVLRWLGDNAWHSRPIQQPVDSLVAYQYTAAAPYDRVYGKVDDPQGTRPGPQYWAWGGCHGATGLVVCALRVLNIPARSRRVALDTGATHLGHRTIELPSESLFLEHADWMYAEPYLLDPSTAPEAICTTAADYASRLGAVAAVPAPGEDRTTLVNRQKARVGLDARTYYFVRAWWTDGLTSPGHFDGRLSALGYTASEIAGIRLDDGPRLQEVVDEFLAANGLTDGPAALAAYEQAYQAWFDARGS